MGRKTGIHIDKIDEDHVWLIYYHDGMKIWSEPLAKVFRDYLEPTHQKDIDSGQVAQGYQPETAFGKLKLSKAIKKEIDIA